MDDERLRETELELARCIARLDHNHECLEELKDKVDRLATSINSLEKTVLTKFAEYTGADRVTRRMAIIASTFISLLIAGVAAAFGG